MGKSIKIVAFIFLMAAVGVAVAWHLRSSDKDQVAMCAYAPNEDELDLVWIPGGKFEMGGDVYPDEGPHRQVEVTGFWMLSHEVTNAQFAKFVAATRYVTVAERVPNPKDFPGIPADKLVPGSVVFVSPVDFSQGFNPMSWWRFVPGANWRQPQGPGSSIQGKDNFPVVHVTYADAAAYAKWAGQELPSEQQWEYASRGGQPRERYAWGNDFMPDGKPMANTWQGIFPVENKAEDGFSGVAPVGCFAANPLGLYDMIGNVWEWTSSVYYPSHNDYSSPSDTGYDPNQPGIPVRVIKGGSFLCAPNYCMRYRPEARHAQDMGLGTDHTGFRTVVNKPGP